MTHVIPALAEANAPKSCNSCRWRVEGAINATSRDPEPSLCGALGFKPIDLTLMTREQAEASRDMIGSSCTWHNSDTINPNLANAVPVGFPMRDVDADSISSYQKMQVASCLTCENYVMPSEVQTIGMGSTRGMCIATGRLLNSGRLSQIASGCEFRRKGEQPNSGEIKLMTLFPEYSVDRVVMWINARAVSEAGSSGLPDEFDPTTHTSAVLDSHVAMGIRAWVRIMDPEGTGNSVELPIFNRAFFSAEEQVKIPTSQDESRPDTYVDYAGILYQVAVAFMQLDETPALWGMPGVGKTEFARYLAWVMQIPFERISITDTTELDDLQGSMRFEDNQTVFHPGRVTRAWGKPSVLLIDEPNVGPRAVWQFLRPLTDNSKQLVVDADRGQVVRRDDNCFLLFAMNPSWDIRNDGTNQLADADIRRLFHVEFNLPDPDTERKIITDHCARDGFKIPDELLNFVMSVAEGLRASENLPVTWGVASNIKVSRYLNWFHPLAAYKKAVADSMEPEVRELILNEVRTKFGTR